jgi:nicotinamidase-related amidase
MPITAFDENTALVLLDLQKGIATPKCIHPVDTVLHHAASLVQCFREQALPIVIVHVEFSADHQDMLAPRADFTYPVKLTPDFATIVPQLPVEPGDIRITKRGWNAFYGTELDLQLRRRKVTGIVLAGIRTSVGVEGTARAAYERGYNITFVSDATSDYDTSAHEHSMTKIFPRMGEIDTTQAIINFIKQSC